MRKTTLSIAISNFAKNAESANTLYFDYMNIKTSLTEALASAFESFREVLTEILTNGDKGNQWQEVVIILQKMHENNQKQFVRAKTPDNRGLKRLIHSKDLSIKIFPNDEQRLEHLSIVKDLINPFNVESFNAVCKGNADGIFVLLSICFFMKTLYETIC